MKVLCCQVIIRLQLPACGDIVSYVFTLYTVLCPSIDMVQVRLFCWKFLAGHDFSVIKWQSQYKDLEICVLGCDLAS